MSDIFDAVISSSATAILQKTYMAQIKTPNGIPTLLCVFDCVDSEEPNYSADVTQHPVEEGTEITDHIQLKNPSLKIVGTISSTPLDLSTTIGNLIAGIQGLGTTSSLFSENALNSGIAAGVGAISAGISAAASGQNVFSAIKSAATPDAASVARTALLSAIQNKSIFDVVTKRQRFSSMVIQDLKFPRDNTTGGSCKFEIDMVQIRIVSNATVQLSSVAEKVATTATTPTKLGSQAASAISSKASSAVGTSLLKKVFG